MSDLTALLAMLLLIGVPTIALPLPFAFLIQSFGPQRWAARRALAVCLAVGAAGYLAALAWFAAHGLPEAVRSNPQASQSIFGQAVMGGFLGIGYGGFAAFIYFYWHRDNPARRRST